METGGVWKVRKPHAQVRIGDQVIMIDGDSDNRDEVMSRLEGGVQCTTLT